jgi:nicotinate phosphoribosyltransferase
VRAILDRAGLGAARIMVGPDLDEYRIRALLAAGAPIDAFGTRLSAGALALEATYRMVELEIGGIKRYTASYGDGTHAMPGAKQIFRDTARDVVARSGECGRGEALLRPVILAGRLIEPLPSLEAARDCARQSVDRLSPALRGLETADPWPVIYSRELRALAEQTRSNLLGKPPAA